ncbi:alkyl hydroperoxide reductase subunit F [Pseudoalteromonas sp. SR44-5]|uniref:alkyl hydroperoxide reductase subunit F n=1 Tax=unclassified Pseudoalteromonas TaxID=194690 RepID=UPI0015FEC590|nr:MULTISPECIES: alkyl hydroperoxide reductase subunit F [unclassified Pseudoalteromonas]MBB1331868.1 alkyl hydroperoxide reductase subunit F [Pseudoalteromonas sp. SR41-6]MBB1340904.1 alkyl hydroperoxide reductase subunit F [Pseudoalteromonas sp. SR45-6]MBB1366002.1 alkyl hydroperoxide reductase subunit F [Pseudoalteromonas sp. SR44-5]MBB1458299.1 alkyl hydroperoxide reductase subunit F [Pseudoalteromonas sp. SG41-8]MBB1469396.1 alkyl hydroperoxide reductase subunit F [Pseudoalteromonas sp. S
MLDTNIKNQLKSHFAAIADPVELLIALDDSKKSIEIDNLANDIASLSDKFLVRDNPDSGVRRPSITVSSPIRDSQITFAGVPMGHEFTSLVLALLHTGGHPSKASAADLDQIKSLTQPLEFEVYISLSCQTCPQVVQALNLMAANNSNIKATMIDGALFQDEVEQRNILAVPAVYLNGQPFSQGAMSLTDILNKVDSKGAERQAASLNEKSQFDVLVVGGGPAGASAAIYSARKGLNTGIVADRFGGQVADTLAIENFISIKATEGPKLVAQLEEHVKEYDVDVMHNQRAVALSYKNGYEITLENGAVLSTKSLVLATGARWREMNVAGEQQYRGHGVAYCPHCDGPLFKGKPVAVIGGGNSGIEAAIDLANIVEHVTVLEFADTLRADDVLIRKANSLENITIIKNAQTTEVLGDGKKVTGLSYTDRTSGENKQLNLAGIFVQIGLIPNTEWLKDSNVELSQFGEIIIDAKGATSLAGVYAAGDATTTPFKQIIIAMGSGATASLGAFDYLIRQTPSEEQRVA